MNAAIRLAVIGVGTIGARHLQLAHEEPECEVVAAADPTPAARDLAKRYGARFYADYTALLEREDLDAVIVAAPNDLHAEIGIACARRGLPMLMEKPITDTLEAGSALLAAAEQAGVQVAVGHHRRFDAAVEAAHAAISGGDIGRVVAVECLWSLRKHDGYYAPPWRRTRPSGGPVLINLIHDLDLLRHLCGEITRIQAETAATVRGNEVEETVALTLRFANGGLGTILACDAAPSPWGWEQGTADNPEVPGTGRNCFRFLGTEGALGFPRLDLWRHDGATPGDWHHTLSAERLAQAPRAALKHQLSHFCGVVRGEHPPRVTGRDGLATLRAALAVHQAAATGRAVDLQPSIG